MRVLVVTPVQAGHLYGRALQSILRQEWEGQLDFLFLRGGDDLVAGAHEKSTVYVNVTRKYNQARQVALDGGYDAVFLAESDMIIPPDALRRLTRVDADVVYGLYCWRHGAYRWNPYTVLAGKVGRSLSEDAERAREAWGKVMEVAGVGMGCTLIHRHVLEQIELRVDADGYACCDWYLAEDCQRVGLVQKCDLGVVCGHLTIKPSPRIIWPDSEAERLYRIEYLGGEWVPVKPGERIEVEVDGLSEVPVPIRRG